VAAAARRNDVADFPRGELRTRRCGGGMMRWGQQSGAAGQIGSGGAALFSLCLVFFGCRRFYKKNSPIILFLVEKFFYKIFLSKLFFGFWMQKLFLLKKFLKNFSFSFFSSIYFLALSIFFKTFS